MEKLKIIYDNHSVHAIGYHFVWCTKYRHPVLVGQIETAVKDSINEICRKYGWFVIAIEVMPDHIHAFIQTTHQDAPYNVIKTLKSITAVQVFTKFPKLKANKFWGSGLWSRGSYYANVGQISQETVLKYIESQKSWGDSSYGTRP